MLGALMGQTAAVRVLLAAKADPNFQFKTEDEELKKKGSKGETALMSACKNGHSDAARALLQSGADALLVDDSGKTALMHCSGLNGSAKDSNAAAALLKIDKSMVNMEDKEGKTAMYHACAAGNAKMVVLLQKHKAKIVLGKLNCYVVAQQAGHVEVCDQIYPARAYLQKKFPTLNTEEEFKAARKVLVDYGDAEMLFREHVRDGIAKDFDEETKDWEKGQLTTTMQRFNPFALLVDGHPAMTKGQDATPGLADSNKCLDDIFLLSDTSTKASDKFLVAANRPENDEHWASDEKKWVGVASMAKHHRFMLLKKPVGLVWRFFNVLVYGMGDEGKETKKLSEAVRLLNDMKHAALEFTKKDPTYEWSSNIGLYFHAYPHCSVNATHLHIVDLEKRGPTMKHLEFKNLNLDDCIKVLEEEERRGAPNRGSTSNMRFGNAPAAAPAAAR